MQRSFNAVSQIKSPAKLGHFLNGCARLINQALFTVILLSAMLGLSACQLTDKSSAKSGLNPISQQGQSKKVDEYTSDIYLDVVIPVFDPGIGDDYQEIDEQGIWPQLRRAEANRFALMTKKALQSTKAFGNISLVPTPQATADLYIIGRILESNSETIALEIEILDISGRRWDKLKFKHNVDDDFFKKNIDADPYQPVFTAIAEHVFALLKRKSEAKKTTIKRITEMRFAQSFSPEAFSKYLSEDRYGHVGLDGLPSTEDPMLNRVAPLRVQEQLFFDRLQTQYEGFSRKTDDSYRLWQQQTLSYMKAARQSSNKSLLKGVAGGAAILLAILAATSGSSDIAHVGTQLGTMLGSHLIKESMKDGAEAKVHYAAIDEMGESLDIEMDAHVISIQDKTIELTGTAQQQYKQWKQHLKRIYLLENTPQKAL